MRGLSTEVVTPVGIGTTSASSIAIPIATKHMMMVVMCRIEIVLNQECVLDSSCAGCIDEQWMVCYLCYHTTSIFFFFLRV